MNQETLIFFVSLIFASITVYVLGAVWFGDTRNRFLRSFFVLGLSVFLWTILNAVLPVMDTEYFIPILTVRMIFVCALPFSLFWFLLNFTKSKLVESRLIFSLTIIIPAIDILFLVTNPLHHLYFTSYTYPNPQSGPIFQIHLIVDIVVVLFIYIRLMIYIFKYARHKPLVICAGFGTLIPYILNLLYTLRVPFLKYDITPLGFFVTFMLFAFSTYRSRISNIRVHSLNSIFASMSDLIVISDESQLLLEANPAFKTAFPDFVIKEGTTTEEDFLGFLIARDTAGAFAEAAAALRSQDEVSGIEISLPINGKDSVAFSVARSSVLRKNKLTGHVLTLTDVSAYHSMINEINLQKEHLLVLKEEAESASASKSAFLANMSHEIRTPLNAVIGMSRIAQQSLLPKSGLALEKARHSIGETITASMHLLEILNDILDMSKIESGKFMLADDPFVLKNALKEVQAIVSQRCVEKSLHLITNIASLPDVTVLGDRLRIKQVLINLLGNAVKFTDVGGDIRLLISSEEKSGYLQLSVSVEDTGIGMTEEQKSRIFMAFEQADKATQARYGGTGLGLAISQHMIRLMGGVIHVNTAPGEGSSFYFDIVLPITEAESNVISTETVPIPDLSGKRILLAEDIEINRIILSELLSETGVTIDEVVDGRQAVTAFERSSEGYYSLIFMDIQMPVLDGYEATREIRGLSRPDARSIPIIAMTANAYREDVEKALNSGMNGHLAKPLNFEDVLRLLSKTIGSV